jgi:BTB/POZ domain.
MLTLFFIFQANPCEHPIVILRDVKEHDMEALLSFMYNGEVRIGQDQLQEFLKTAQTLQVRGLTDVPPKDHYKFLNVSIDNRFEFIYFSKPKFQLKV